jgi:AcrR family transcriptional regulator
MPKRLSIPAPQTREVAWVEGARTERAKKVILESANRLFLERGYNAVKVDDIVEAAGLSRATFYVYFPSKRDVFLAIGIHSIAAGMHVAEALEKLPLPLEAPDLIGWISDYFEYLEHFGAFIRSWEEAMADDAEVQAASRLQVMRFCRRLGLALERIRGGPRGDATLQGLALRFTLEGVWYFWRVNEMPHERAEVIDTLCGIVKTYAQQDAA